MTLRTGHKRAHSSSTDPETGTSRSKVKRHRRHRDLQVGIGDRTPPHASDEGGMDLDPTDGDGRGDEIGGPVVTDVAASELPRDGASPSEEEMELDESEGAPSEPTAVPVSFYGEHKPLSDSQPPFPTPLSMSAATGAGVLQQPSLVTSTTTVGSSSPLVPPSTTPSVPSSNIQSILSQHSKEKIQELASVVSTLNQAGPSPSALPPPLISSNTAQVTASTSAEQTRPQGTEPAPPFPPHPCTPLPRAGSRADVKMRELVRSGRSMPCCHALSRSHPTLCRRPPRS